MVMLKKKEEKTLYKLISCTDRQGIEKVEFMNELKEKHPNMIGEFISFDALCQFVIANIPSVCVFEWFDISNKILRTSVVEYIVGKLGDDNIQVVTMNSIYEFVRVEE